MGNTLQEQLISHLEESVSHSPPPDPQEQSKKGNYSQKAISKYEHQLERDKDALNPLPNKSDTRRRDTIKELIWVWEEFGEKKDEINQQIKDIILLLQESPYDITGLKLVNTRMFEECIEKYILLEDDIENLIDKISEESVLLLTDAEIGNLIEKEDQLKDIISAIGMLYGKAFAELSMEIEKAEMGRVSAHTKSSDDVSQKGLEKVEMRWGSIAGMGKEEYALFEFALHKILSPILESSASVTYGDVAYINNLLHAFITSPQSGQKEDPRIRPIIGDTLKDLQVHLSEKGCVMGQLIPLGKTQNELDSSPFGRNRIRWNRDEIKASIFFADSLYVGTMDIDYVCPCMIDNPKPYCFSPTCRPAIEKIREGCSLTLSQLCDLTEVPFCEVAIYHPTIEQIEAVELNDVKDIAMFSSEVKQAIAAYNIPIMVNGTKVDLQDQANDDEGLTKERKT